MAGLLDGLPGLDTPQGQGLLAAAFNLMSAKGPSFANAIGDAGRSYMGATQNAADNAAQNEVRRLQIDSYKRKAEQELLAAKERARINDLMRNAGAQGLSSSGIDYQGLIRQGVPIEQVKALAESRNLGRDTVARTADIEGPNGSKIVQGFDAYGQPVGQGMPGYIAPVAVNQGDRTTFFKPTPGVSLQTNRSPDNVASVGASMANAGATRAMAQAQFGINNELKNIQLQKAQSEQQDREALKQGAISGTADSIDVLQKAIDHPGRKAATGISSLNPINSIPGTDAKNFSVVLDQIKGKAFMQAYQTLKGGGQITEVEGKKATDAIARLNTAQSEAEFLTSLKDLKTVMDKGYERLAGKPYAQPPAAPAPGNAKFLGFE